MSNDPSQHPLHNADRGQNRDTHGADEQGHADDRSGKRRRVRPATLPAAHWEGEIAQAGIRSMKPMAIATIQVATPAIQYMTRLLVR